MGVASLGLFEQPLLDGAAFVLGEAFRAHRVAGGEHFGQDDQAGARSRGLVEQGQKGGAGGRCVLEDDVVLYSGDLHDSPFNLVSASARTSGRLQKANRTKLSPAAES